MIFHENMCVVAINISINNSKSLGVHNSNLRNFFTAEKLSFYWVYSIQKDIFGKFHQISSLEFYMSRLAWIWISWMGVWKFQTKSGRLAGTVDNVHLFFSNSSQHFYQLFIAKFECWLFCIASAAKRSIFCSRTGVKCSLWPHKKV